MNTPNTTIISNMFHNATKKGTPYPTNVNTILSILLITVIVLSICAFCYQIANSGGEDRYMVNNYSPNNIKINRLINLGIISTIIITDNNKPEYSHDDCCICLNEVIIHDSIYLLPCNHHFHKDCIRPWLLEKQTCPLCKLDLINYIEESTASNTNPIRIELV